MIGDQAHAGERHSQSENGSIDQQTGFAETLALTAGRITAADMIEPALPVRAAAVAFRGRIVKQWQIEKGLDSRYRPALRDQSRTTHRNDLIGHQHRYAVAWIISAAEADCEVNAGSAKIQKARICDQLQLDLRVKRVKLWQPRNKPPRCHRRQRGDLQSPIVGPRIQICDGTYNVGDRLIHALRQCLSSARQFEAPGATVEQSDAEFLLE